jgi:hypothetical protein
MGNNIVEIAQFRLANGVSEQDFLREVEDVQNNFLSRQSGYIDRELLKSGEGQWIDIVHWSSMEKAQLVAEVMLKDPSALGFLQKIDPQSVDMMHLQTMRIWDR